MNAIRTNRSIVTKADFVFALEEVRPAIPKELADRIKRFKERAGNDVQIGINNKSSNNRFYLSDFMKIVFSDPN